MIGAHTFVVDTQHKVLTSDAPDLREGETLTPASWLGDATLDAMMDAMRAESAGHARRVGRDSGRGATYIVDVEWKDGRAHVTALDVTLAVATDRVAVLAKIVHAIRNAGFALLSVVDALDGGREIARLDEYIAHLREPAHRLSTTMRRLAACIDPVRLTPARVTLAALAEAAIARTAASHKPLRTHADDGAVSIDEDLLATALAGLLECGASHAESLDLTRDGDHARVTVRVRPAEERSLDAVWDLSGGRDLEIPLRLAAARVAIVAHGAEPLASRPARGVLAVGFRIPLLP